MQWGGYQEAIFDLYNRFLDNMIINACPGSGKTTTIREIWNRSKERTLYLAFNVSIVKEAKEKLVQKNNSDILTLNGLGHRACLKAFPQITLDKNKVYKIIDRDKDHVFLNPKTKWQDKQALFRCVQLMKSEGKCWELPDITKLIDFYGCDAFHNMEKHALDVYNSSLKDTATLDFADQLLYPVHFALELPTFDLVLVDESQDLNAIQSAMVANLGSNSRYIFVGDPRQAIYGFRGAMSNSMQHIESIFKCNSMPLKLSYRCPKSIVSEAQYYYPDDIEALDTAPMGIIRKGSDSETYNPTDMILCRNMAPLATKAFELLRQGFPCQIKGRDIGTNLTNYIKRLNCKGLLELQEATANDFELNFAMAARDRNFHKMQSLEDKYETLKVFMENTKSKTVQGVLDYISDLFENGKGTLLSTIHRAKGLESDRVFQLGFHELLPNKYAVRSGKDWQLEQERNLQYVAVTRSKQELVYLTDDVRNKQYSGK